MRTTTPITALSATFQHGLTRISRTQPRPETPDMIMKRVELSIGVRVRVSGHGRLSRVNPLGPLSEASVRLGRVRFPDLGRVEGQDEVVGEAAGGLEADAAAGHAVVPAEVGE